MVGETYEDGKDPRLDIDYKVDSGINDTSGGIEEEQQQDQIQKFVNEF